MGRGASTCTTCDAPLFKNKTIAVIGGGNSAVEGALDAANYATKVYLIHRRTEFKADTVTVDKARANPKIEFLAPYAPVAIHGQKLITSLAIRHTGTGAAQELPLHGVFIEIGYETNISLVKGLVEQNSLGELVVDERCRTKTPGLYAAGDLTSVAYKQTVISAGMGAIAALEVHRYLTGAGGSEYAK